MKETAQTRRLNKECEGPTFGVGSIGKVRVLMMQELDSVSSKRRPSNATVPVSVHCCETRKRSQVKKTKSDQRNSTSTGCRSSSSSSNKRKTGINVRKKVHHQSPSSQSIPMLKSEDITPARGCQVRQKTRIVEIVDLKCGNSEKGWSSPITDQLRRLSFSKLSD